VIERNGFDAGDGFNLDFEHDVAPCLWWLLILKVTALLAILRGWQAVSGGEDARKKLQVVIGGLLRHLPDRQIAMRQQCGGALQTQPLHRRGNRLAQHSVIDAMPVIGRQTRDVRQLVQVQFFVEMVMDISRDPTQPCFVIRLVDGCFHRERHIELVERNLTRPSLTILALLHFDSLTQVFARL
jgi:hypothetical protein